MSGEHVCERCVILTESITNTLTYDSENVWWIPDDARRFWEPVLLVEVESLDDKDKSVFGRFLDNHYHTLDLSHCVKRPQMSEKTQAIETIKHILKAYVNLCRDTEISKGKKVTLVGKDGEATEIQIEEIVCKDRVSQKIQLHGTQGEIIIPTEPLQIMRTISNGKFKMDSRVTELVMEYDNLRTGTRQKMENCMVTNYTAANNEWSQNFARQKAQETLMEILMESYFQMKVHKDNIYQQLAKVLCDAWAFKDPNKERQTRTLDKLVLNYFYDHRKALFAAHTELGVEIVYESASKKVGPLDVEGANLLTQFVKECCQVTWNMLLISPNVTLLPSTVANELEREGLSLTSTDFERMPGSDENSTAVLYISWPALVWNKGRVAGAPIYCVMRNVPFYQAKDQENKSKEMSIPSQLHNENANENNETNAPLQQETRNSKDGTKDAYDGNSKPMTDIPITEQQANVPQSEQQSTVPEIEQVVVLESALPQKKENPEEKANLQQKQLLT